MYHKHKEECIVIALDAKKAFDHLYVIYFKPLWLWKYVHKLDYHHLLPTPSLHYYQSQPFNLQRGVRQGCSCSPHLFNLCIEVLACQIRANPDYKPIQLYGKNHHLSLLHPKTTLPTHLHIINNIWEFVGLHF